MRVRTVVREDEAAIDEPTASEAVEIERVPLDRWVKGPVPVRQGGDTMIVTLVEEVVVVEKRVRATEKVRPREPRGSRDAGAMSSSEASRAGAAV